MRKKIVFGLLILLIILLSISTFILYFQKKIYKNNLANLNTKLEKNLMPKPGENIYTNPNGAFKIRLPYGWDPQQTEYWFAVKHNKAKNDSDNILIYHTTKKDVEKYTADGQLKREQNESLLSYEMRQNNDIYSKNGTPEATPILTDVSYAGREAVIEDCPSITIKGGGYMCTNTGTDFNRELHMEDGFGGYFLVSIQGEKTDYSYTVDLTDWIDRIFSTE